MNNIFEDYDFVKELVSVISKRSIYSPTDIAFALNRLQSVDRTLLAMNIAATHAFSLNAAVNR